MTQPSHLTRRSVLATAAALATTAGFAGAPALNTPAPPFYRMRVGAFEVTIVTDGLLSLGPPSGDLFKGISKEEVTAALADNYLPTDRIALEQNAVVVNTGRELVLFDTGVGPTLKSFGPDAGRLLDNLRAAGIDPASIDVVALTHAHPDHCFGLMSAEATRNFPNARIFISEADFKFWTDESLGRNDMLKAMIGGARQSLLPNRDRITFVKDGQDIVPGIQAMLTPGHTVGHTSYMVASQGQTLFNMADVCHHHVLSTARPRMPLSFDTDGAQGVQTRLKTLDMLASTRTMMVAYHFPWPGIGYIGRQGDAYRYIPAPLRTVL